MIEEPYSDRIVGMEIMAMMMRRREHVGLENNDSNMFWRAMEGSPEERDTRRREVTESIRERVKRKERNNKKL